MRAHVPPEEPVEALVEDVAEVLAQMSDDVLFRPRRASERDRERGDPLGVDTAGDLDPIPRGTLGVLRGDRERVEVARAHQMQRPAHEPRADHRMALDRRPEPLARESGEARPERDIWRGRPLRLERGDPLDRVDDVEPGAPQQQLAREGRAIQPAKREDRQAAVPRHARTPCVRASGA